ncbi:metallophosphoesterase family protein [Phenylobacterium sp.]|uniref:metallophosphoesterase family protein n=1 Tax=Phenylobacterium sp. TaxID=1871053 RepID=UPI002BF259AE|nr:metallophosphoesterase [Phenylobacterium sp.]HLZ74111.1 metallophosphoesterase [Phenylobacterium sp.]
MSDHDNAGEDRRGFLKCMAWAGTGALFTASGGLLSSISLDEAVAAPAAAKGFTFLQISDSHVGFNKPANPDSAATYKEAVSKIIAMPVKPDFIIHTGDITQLSKDQEFDDADQIIKAAGLQVFHVPGEHDMLDEGAGKAYLDRFGKGTKGAGWYSFDHKGVHFVALINVVNLKAGGMGSLGADQLAWLEKDLAGRPSSQPIVVFAHIPLWTVYADWGWGTDDATQALSYMKRFGSVTVLNGHIHQITQKVEGNIAFHTARSTAFPQPVGGQGPSPGPLKVPTEQLHSMLGITTATFVRGKAPIALVDQTLAT